MRCRKYGGRGQIAAALMVDLRSAFPSVTKECLVKEMREMGFDKNLVEWTKSFMEERWVVIALDGYEGPEIEVILGLPQGSAVSPVLFAIYIADITWQVVGDDAELTKKLE
jgi:hypothetical protein